jgi:hypothetical protein
MNVVIYSTKWRKNDKNKCQKAWDNLDKNGYICF